MRYRTRRKLKFSCFVGIVAVLLCFVLVFAQTNIKPIMLEMALNDAQSVNEGVINKAIYDTLTEENVNFNDLIKINYDENNVVKSVAVDSPRLGKIKLKIIQKIVKGFKKVDTGTIYVRLGTFLDNEFTYGRGPNIKFNYEMSNTITCDYNSEFISTGINQAKHRFSLDFTTDVYIVTPLFSTKTKFESAILLNEMVIVGEVPSDYTGIDIK